MESIKTKTENTELFKSKMDTPQAWIFTYDNFTK